MAYSECLCLFLSKNGSLGSIVMCLFKLIKLHKICHALNLKVTVLLLESIDLSKVDRVVNIKKLYTF